MNDAQSEPLECIGFWRDEGSVILSLVFPHPRELVDSRWNQEERERVADYLARGVSLCGYYGYSHCRFPGGPPDEEMGTDDLTDGRWVWPQALPLYVRRYAVRLPQEFLKDARQRQFQIPLSIDVERLRQRPYSYARWVRWACGRRTNRLFALLAWLLIVCVGPPGRTREQA